VEVSNKADSSSVLALAGLNTSGLFSQAELLQNCKTKQLCTGTSLGVCGGCLAIRASRLLLKQIGLPHLVSEHL